MMVTVVVMQMFVVLLLIHFIIKIITVTLFTDRLTNKLLVFFNILLPLFVVINSCHLSLWTATSTTTIQLYCQCQAGFRCVPIQ